ncbi:MAG: hypothetical protein K8R59_01955 [Thermoanaerobaculales bacterium]|nr:hypothetical protein [Thermoanaerobaculales bacterium]
MEQLFDIEGRQYLEAAIEMGRGGLLICGHIGSWQVGPYLLGRLLGQFHVVARPPDNPYVALDA